MLKSIPTRFFATSAVFALIGMIWGIQMSISHNHTLSPAHAHLNLIGFVIMAVYGVYYALTPAAGASRAAGIHYWLTFAAVVVMTPGIALAITENGEAPAAIGSILALISMGMFLRVILRHGVGALHAGTTP
ncbi:hypothetical protein [Amaricoccus tamworthensis]|uniref:hypothetical protein n=1 Tax=Amaricoccus tamworthensis TaxID=57002 RepID=UPI003C7CE669